VTVLQNYYKRSSNRIDIILTDYLDIPQNSATIDVTVVDAVTGQEIDGQSWPLTLDYVSSSAGHYEGILTHALEVVEGQNLRMQVLAVSGEVQRYWEIDILVIVGDQ
jgi:hypothetical protein